MNGKVEVPLRTLIDQYVSPLIEGRYVPSIVAATYHQGAQSIIGYGSLSDGQAPDQSPNRETVFETGSVGKVFTAILLVEAARRGEVQLQQPIQEIRPSLARISCDSAPIRLSHLATHTSGLPRIPDDLDLQSENPYEGYSHEKLWQFLDRVEITHAAGAHYDYSNVGAGLLGLLLEEATGLSYADQIEQRIVNPLGLIDTTVQLTESQLTRLAPPTAFGMPSQVWSADDALFASGCLRSTAQDTLRFLEAHLQASNDDLGVSLLRCLEPFHSEGIDLPTSGERMGLGWHLTAEGVAWHNGSTGGYHAFLALDPTHDFALALMANDVCPEVTDVGFQILDAVADRTPPALESWIPIPLDPRQLKQYEGQYVDAESGASIHIHSDAGGLAVQFDDQPAYRALPRSQKIFEFRIVAAELRFQIRPGHATPTAVTLHQDGVSQRYVRARSQ